MESKLYKTYELEEVLDLYINKNGISTILNKQNYEPTNTNDINKFESSNKYSKYDKKSLKNFLYSYGKEIACKEDLDIDTDAKQHREEQDNLGIENEKRVKEHIRKYDKNFKVLKMKDCSGYDLKVQINNRTYRLEVKTINKDLEFDISINQLNSIFNKNNYAIAVVNKKDIYLVENVEETLGLSEVFVHRLIEEQNKSSMIAVDFKIKLSLELFENLKTLDEYLQSILIENEISN